jgi:hypothetical protein
MNRKLVSSLITATTLFTSVLPAFAGEQQSWISGDTLAQDPKALCSDVGLGSNIQNNNSSSSSSSRTASARNSSASGASSSFQSSTSSHNDGGGGNVSVLGLFSVGGNGGSQGSNSGSASNSSRYAQASASSQSGAFSQSNAFNRDSSTVVTGKNCDAFVGAAAARDIAHDNNLTTRYGVDAQVRINESNNQTAVQLFNSQHLSGVVSNLTQWYSPQH